MLKKIVILSCFLAIACDVPLDEQAVVANKEISYEVRTPNLKFALSDETIQALLQTKRDFDFSGFLDALDDVADDDQYTAGSEWSPHETLDLYEYENDNAKIMLNPMRLSLVVRDKRGYDVSEENETPEATDDKNLIELSKKLISALGSTEYEFGEPQVRYLASWSREVDAANGEEIDYTEYPLTKTRLARKAFFIRTIDGINVDEDRMVVSFALDGTFRKMKGRWSPIDWGKSTLSVDITENQFRQKLNQFLEKEDMVRIAEDAGVDATTCFVPTLDNRESNSEPVPVELKGCATLFKSNGVGDGGGMFETFVFDLD